MAKRSVYFGLIVKTSHYYMHLRELIRLEKENLGNPTQQVAVTPPTWALAIRDSNGNEWGFPWHTLKFFVKESHTLKITFTAHEITIEGPGVTGLLDGLCREKIGKLAPALYCALDEKKQAAIERISVRKREI